MRTEPSRSADSPVFCLSGVPLQVDGEGCESLLGSFQSLRNGQLAGTFFIAPFSSFNRWLTSLRPTLILASSLVAKHFTDHCCGGVDHLISVVLGIVRFIGGKS